MHRNNCQKLKSAWLIKGYDSYVNCIKKELQPCVCCAKGIQVSEQLQTEQLNATTLNDVYTLTNPNFAFWAGIGYTTFHTMKYSKLEHIPYLRGFSKYEDALHAKLKPCKYCSPKPKQNLLISVPSFQQVRKNETIECLDILCKQEGYATQYNAPFYEMQTPIGKWRINTQTLP